MTIFQRAVERLTSFVKRLSCAAPRKVLAGLRSASLHACETGCASGGYTSANLLRMFCGAVGAKSGLPVCGLSQTLVADTLAERNERSSRKNSSALAPQRTFR
jgi:hypothetical protein